MLIAVTRQVSRSITECELTFLERQPIDLQRARQQHSQYETALKDLGLAVLSLPEAPDLPDSVFVEDTALVLDECAILMRCAASSRRAETSLMAEVLRPYRSLHRVEAPAQIDGGDILRVGKDIFIGLSSRSNAEAIEQIRALVIPLGYAVHSVAVTGCLHLKSAVTQVAPEAVLINPAWVDRHAFPGVEIIEIEASEAYAANALLVGETVIYPSAFPKTRARLEAAGVHVRAVDADELAKAEGAVTCCSVLFTA